MENTILFSLMTKTMENTMCSSSDDVDDEDYMENTMCSSSDDVDDEDYMENTICVLLLMMLMTKTMENTMCSSSLPLEKCLSQYVSIKKLL